MFKREQSMLNNNETSVKWQFEMIKWYDMIESEKDVSVDTVSEGSSISESEIDLANAHNIDGHRPQQVRLKPDFFVMGEGF